MGCRFIPMTNEVFQSLKRIIENRPKLKIEPFVDGYTGFILVDKNGNPKIALHIENEIRVYVVQENGDEQVFRVFFEE